MITKDFVYGCIAGFSMTFLCYLIVSSTWTHGVYG